MESSNLMEKIVSLAKRRGFIFPGSEIYGGLAGTWDYGPLGVELKNNLKKEFWRTMVYMREDTVGLDAAERGLEVRLQARRLNVEVFVHGLVDEPVQRRLPNVAQLAITCRERDVCQPAMNERAALFRSEAPQSSPVSRPLSI